MQPPPDLPPSGSRPVRIVAGALLLGCFVLGFTLTSILARTRLDPPSNRLARHKRVELRERGGLDDVLFVGNSRVYRSIVPAEFDPVASSADLQVRSYNLATPGMSMLEAHRVLRGALEDRRRPVGWVVVGLDTGAGVDPGDGATLRFVDWHGGPETLLALRYERARKDGPGPLGVHLRGWLAGGTGRGYLSAVLRESPEDRARNPPPDSLGLVDGYLALEDDPRPGIEARRESFRRGLRRYRKRVRALARTPLPPPHLDGPDRLLLDGVIRLVERAGGRVIFFVSPVLRRSDVLGEGLLEVRGRPVLRFDSPERYPELYEPGHRFDDEHLDRRGARILSRELGRRFRALREAEGR